MSYDEEDELMMSDDVDSEDEPLDLSEDEPLEVPEEEDYDPDDRYH
jgi:hypothetical protein